MSAVPAVLPYVWAYAFELTLPTVFAKPAIPAEEPDTAFYRCYTEGMLRRYVRISMEVGKVPSMLGQEMFRGKVTSYRVDHFDDMVNDLEMRDAAQEVKMQTELLKAGVLTVDEVREMRGLPKLGTMVAS